MAYQTKTPKKKLTKRDYVDSLTDWYEKATPQQKKEFEKDIQKLRRKK